MLFLGNSFLGNKYSLDPTTIFAPNLTMIKIQNSIFDNIFISSNTNYDLSELAWGFDTVFWAEFNNSLSAGNIAELLNDISSVLIKRRRVGTYNWLPLFEIPINTPNDLIFERFDRYVANHVEYEYAAIFMLGDVEGGYNVNSIIPSFDGLFIVSKDKIFASFFEHQISVKRNHPSSLVSTVDSRYPFLISHSKNNFDSGSVTSSFVELKENGCQFDFEGAYKYRRDLLDELCDGNVKFLKLKDGRIWMIVIVGDPEEYEESHTQKFTTTFNWAEIGDPENINDLYDSGLIDLDIRMRE